MKPRLHNLIFTGMVAGTAVGLVLAGVEDKSSPTYGAVIWWLDLLGPTLFMGALKMIIAPLILASIVAGLVARYGVEIFRTLGWYCATVIGGILVHVVFLVAIAAVPDAGLVTMVLVASAVHLPIYYIPLIFAVDALLDMFRTSTNVLGDAVGAIVVNRLEAERLGEA